MTKKSRDLKRTTILSKKAKLMLEEKYRIMQRNK